MTDVAVTAPAQAREARAQVPAATDAEAQGGPVLAPEAAESPRAGPAA